MNIYEALQEAEKTSGVIYRQSTEKNKMYAGKCRYNFRLDLNGISAQKDFSESWAPTAEDLMATDWEVLDEQSRRVKRRRRQCQK